VGIQGWHARMNAGQDLPPIGLAGEVYRPLTIGLRRCVIDHLKRNAIPAQNIGEYAVERRSVGSRNIRGHDESPLVRRGNGVPFSAAPSVMGQGHESLLIRFPTSFHANSGPLDPTPDVAPEARRSGSLL
jgi:hypothetical protein